MPGDSLFKVRKFEYGGYVYAWKLHNGSSRYSGSVACLADRLNFLCEIARCSVLQSLAIANVFLVRCFHPDVGGDTFLRNVGF
jgi:hypothetical protein